MHYPQLPMKAIEPSSRQELTVPSKQDELKSSRHKTTRMSKQKDALPSRWNQSNPAKSLSFSRRVIAPSPSSRILMRSVSGLGMEDPVFGTKERSVEPRHPSQLFDDIGLEDLPSDMRDLVSVASDPTADVHEGMDVAKFHTCLEDLGGSMSKYSRMELSLSQMPITMAETVEKKIREINEEGDTEDEEEEEDEDSYHPHQFTMDDVLRAERYRRENPPKLVVRKQSLARLFDTADSTVASSHSSKEGADKNDIPTTILPMETASFKLDPALGPRLPSCVEAKEEAHEESVSTEEVTHVQDDSKAGSTSHGDSSSKLDGSGPVKCMNQSLLGIFNPHTLDDISVTRSLVEAPFLSESEEDFDDLQTNSLSQSLPELSKENLPEAAAAEIHADMKETTAQLAERLFQLDGLGPGKRALKRSMLAKEISKRLISISTQKRENPRKAPAFMNLASIGCSDGLDYRPLPSVSSLFARSEGDSEGHVTYLTLNDSAEMEEILFTPNKFEDVSGQEQQLAKLDASLSRRCVRDGPMAPPVRQREVRPKLEPKLELAPAFAPESTTSVTTDGAESTIVLNDQDLQFSSDDLTMPTFSTQTSSDKSDGINSADFLEKPVQHNGLRMPLRQFSLRGGPFQLYKSQSEHTIETNQSPSESTVLAPPQGWDNRKLPSQSSNRKMGSEGSIQLDALNDDESTVAMPIRRWDNAMAKHASIRALNRKRSGGLAELQEVPKDDDEDTFGEPTRMTATNYTDQISLSHRSQSHTSTSGSRQTDVSFQQSISSFCGSSVITEENEITEDDDESSECSEGGWDFEKSATELQIASIDELAEEPLFLDDYSNKIFNSGDSDPSAASRKRDNFTGTSVYSFAGSTLIKEEEEDEDEEEALDEADNSKKGVVRVNVTELSGDLAEYVNMVSDRDVQPNAPKEPGVASKDDTVQDIKFEPTKEIEFIPQHTTVQSDPKQEIEFNPVKTFAAARNPVATPEKGFNTAQESEAMHEIELNPKHEIDFDPTPEIESVAPQKSEAAEKLKVESTATNETIIEPTFPSIAKSMWTGEVESSQEPVTNMERSIEVEEVAPLEDSTTSESAIVLLQGFWKALVTFDFSSPEPVQDLDNPVSSAVAPGAFCMANHELFLWG